MPYFNPGDKQNEIPDNAWTSNSFKDPSKMLGTLAGFISPIIGTLVNGAMSNAAWSDTNDYNSPAAQMRRLQQAGINPYQVTGSIASQNQASPKQAPQIQLEQIFSNIGQLMQLRSLEKDIEGKDIQNSIAATQLQYTDDFQQQKLKQYILSNIATELSNQYRRGEISIQQYRENILKVNDLLNSLVYHPGQPDENGNYQNPLDAVLSKFGIDTAEFGDSIPLGVFPKLFDSLSSSMDVLFQEATFNARTESEQQRLNMLKTQYQQLQENLRHTTTMNSKQEQMYMINQILGILQSLMSLFGAGVSAAQGINYIQNNPYAQ